MPDRRPRCPAPGCPVRYAGGLDRPCPEHRGETVPRLVTRTPPGAKRTRITAALLRNPERGNYEIAGAVRASPAYVAKARHKLERSGEIAAWRGKGIRRAEARDRITAALLAWPARSNRVIAAAARADSVTVLRIRHELEAAGKIRPYRAENGARRWREAAVKVRALLAADPAASSAEIAALAGLSSSTVGRVRRQMQAGRDMCVWRRGRHVAGCWCQADGDD